MQTWLNRVRAPDGSSDSNHLGRVDSTPKRYIACTALGSPGGEGSGVISFLGFGTSHAFKTPPRSFPPLEKDATHEKAFRLAQS